MWLPQSEIREPVGIPDSEMSEKNGDLVPPGSRSHVPEFAMHSRYRRALIATLACSFWLAAAQGAVPSASTEAGRTADPCQLISDTDVRRAFADAKAGTRDTRLDQYGIATCSWDTPTNTF